MTFFGTCEICGRPVTSPETPAYRIEGWTYASAHKAAGSIIGRQRVPGRVAHKPCVEYPPATESLFSSPTTEAAR